jgi:hypothetical protein
MAKLKFDNFRLLFSKCLLAGILFFSFIAIAGYRSSPNSISCQNRQTELVYSKAGSFANQTVSYQKLLLPTKNTPFASRQTEFISILIYQKLVKVKLNCLSKKILPFKNSSRLFPFKSIRKNSEEDYFTPFTS